MKQHTLKTVVLCWHTNFRLVYFVLNKPNSTEVGFGFFIAFKNAIKFAYIFLKLMLSQKD